MSWRKHTSSTQFLYRVVMTDIFTAAIKVLWVCVCACVFGEEAPDLCVQAGLFVCCWCSATNRRVDILHLYAPSVWVELAAVPYFKAVYKVHSAKVTLTSSLLFKNHPPRLACGFVPHWTSQHLHVRKLELSQGGILGQVFFTTMHQCRRVSKLQHTRFIKPLRTCGHHNLDYITTVVYSA